MGTETEIKMETESSEVSTWRPFCRACLATDALTSLVDGNGDLKDRFHDTTTVEIQEDGLPAYLCLNCLTVLNRCHEFKKQCITIDNQLKSELSELKVIDSDDLNSESIIDIEKTQIKTEQDMDEDDVYVIVVNQDNNDDNDVIKSPTHNKDTNVKKESSEIKGESATQDYETLYTIHNNDETMIPSEINGVYIDDIEEKKNSYDPLKIAKTDFPLDCELPYNNNDDINDTEKLNIINLFKDSAPINNGIIKLEDDEALVDDVFPSEITAEDVVTYTQEEIVVANADDTYEIINCDISELNIENFGKPLHVELDVPQQEDGAFLCECGLSFMEHADYEKHAYVHNKFTCPLCGKGFESEEVVTGHMMLHENPLDSHLNCPFCHKSFKRNFFTVHINMHHTPYRPTCPICNKTFATEHNRKRHMLTHTGTKEFGCDICHMQFNQKTALQNHRLTHNSLGHISCNSCFNDFSSAEALRIHIDEGCEAAISEESNGDKKSFCNKCKKNFANADALRSHMENVHVQQSDLLCSECGLVLPTKKAMHAHSLIHRQNRSKNPKRFCCGICGKGVASQAMLTMHERVHTNERPFKCRKCSFAFKTKTHLTTHQLTHTQEKRFGCSVCLKFFALKGNLVVHLRTHTGERPYVCNLCNQAFIDSKYLKKHKLRRHSNDNTFL